MGIFEPLRADVRVDLRRSDIGVSEELLNHPEIRAAF
jgi:hypothetical protein